MRTDFAQVEEDLQQINLTRFSVFFPEKRDFFIEGQGIFDFGGVQAGNSPGDVPLLFFSRQIGLSQGQAVPVLGGARLTGRAGPYSIGALDIQTDDAPAARAVSTNFSALRLKRNLLRRSNVGMIATRRGPGIEGVAAGRHDASYSVGADATLLFLKSINLTGYYALTSGPDALPGPSPAPATADGSTTPTIATAPPPSTCSSTATSGPRSASCGEPTSGAPSASCASARGRGAAPSSASSPGRAASTTSPMRRPTTVQSREAAGLFRVDFQSSDQASAEYTREFERLPDRFVIAPGVVVPAGGYTATTGRAQLHARPAAPRLGTAVGGDRHAATTAPSPSSPTAAAGAWCRASRSSRA